MPIHDWTRVDPGLFHAFRLSWVVALSDWLNNGGLPPEYYVLLTERSRSTPDADESVVYAQKADRIAIYREPNHVVAYVDVVSPGHSTRPARSTGSSQADLGRIPRRALPVPAGERSFTCLLRCRPAVGRLMSNRWASAKRCGTCRCSSSRRFMYRCLWRRPTTRLGKCFQRRSRGCSSEVATPGKVLIDGWRGVGHPSDYFSGCERTVVPSMRK